MKTALNLEDYKVLKTFLGNESNKIYLLEDKTTKENFIFKRIKIYNLDVQIREIQIQKNIDHVYIIKLIDYFIGPEYIDLIIEYAPKGDLFEFINSLKCIKESTILTLFYKIVKSIDFVHSKGFIHRDIKPENILVGDDFQPKLADFGSSVSHLKVRNTFCGTYEYMAPEIYKREVQTEKVDIWALGVLLYEMTHNNIPFRDKCLGEIQLIITNENIDFDSQISQRIQNIIYKILKLDPTERPTAKDILLMPELIDINERIKLSAKEDLDKIYADGEEELDR